MKKNLKIDLLINVFLPLVIGLVFYFSNLKQWLPKFFINYIPDCVWAYSFQSAILIVWGRRVNIKWTIAIFSSGVLFEILQYLNVIHGTADFFDIAAYFTFFIIALFSNKFFSRKYTYNEKNS